MKITSICNCFEQMPFSFLAAISFDNSNKDFEKVPHDSSLFGGLKD